MGKALFPIGDLEKSEVREIARKHQLVTAEKKDSQGLCFIGKVRLPEFLQQQLKPKKGNVIEIPSGFATYDQIKAASSMDVVTAEVKYGAEDGEVIGEHNGAHYYTVGQRKGLNIGGKPEPLFVIGTNTEENIIYMGQGDHHPGLYRKGLFVPSDDIHWIRTDLALQPGEQKDYLARIRYRQPLQACTIYQEKHGLYVIFEQEQRGITPGQFVAWYMDDEVLGSGVIQ